MVDFNQVARNLFRAPCYDQLHKYTSSKQYLKELRRAPVNTEENFEPSVLMEQKKINIQGVMQTNIRLLHKKEEALRMADHLANEKMEIYKKEKELQENFLNFNNLIVQNRVKRERVHARTKELKVTNLRRQEEIEKISNEIEKMKENKTMFLKQINKYMFYEDFLKRIPHEDGQKVSCVEVIQRFVNLNSNREYVTNIDIGINERIKEYQLKAVNLMNERHGRILDLRKQITDLITEYKIVKYKTPQLEILVFDIWADCYARLECLIQCVRSIDSLNEQIRRRKRERNIAAYTSWEIKNLGNVPSVMKNVMNLNTTMRVFGRLSKAVESYLKTVKKLAEKNQNDSPENEEFSV